MSASRRLILLVVLGLGYARPGYTDPHTPGAPPGLQVQGTGKAQRLIRDQFAPATRAGYDLFAVKCTKCHEMARPIAALKTGVTPISGGNFEEKGIKEYVVKMMRKPNSGITKDDAKQIINFLRDARSRASH